MSKLNEMYKKYIYDRYLDLINSGKTKLTVDNYDLAKIFEWFTCLNMPLSLPEEQFYVYDDIDPNFKEEHKLSKNDTGIDICNLIDTIGQCKLRSNNLQWGECGTFFGSQNIYSEDLKQTIVKWQNMTIIRNDDCKLSKVMEDKKKQKLFNDITFSKTNMINYCETLIKNPPKFVIDKVKKIKLRDYQLECIELITSKKENLCICLPTGTGKNVIIISSLQNSKFYLILVPRIILMEQIYDEILNIQLSFKGKIQCIGDGGSKFDRKVNITICVYNSIDSITKFDHFERIFIDEAHHIYKPEIYKMDDDDNDVNDSSDEKPIKNNKLKAVVELDSDEELPVKIKKNKSKVVVDDSSEDERPVKIKKNKSNIDIKSNISEKSTIKIDSDDIVDTYTDKIIQLKQYNNNVYLSATIDKIDGFNYYTKDIREMINKKYLCDYVCTVPIFSNDPTNKNICEYLVARFRNIIIYCNTQAEGKKINDLMNSVQKKCSQYIDCATSKSQRTKTLDAFKNGSLPFLVNVKILVEGFDAPIVKGVCFIHMPQSKTALIQIIGRALRLHAGKTFANIILPYSCDTDGKAINNFLKIMASVDTRIRKSYDNKTLGGYISVDNTCTSNESCTELVEHRFDMVYDSLGTMIGDNVEKWKGKLKLIEEYIDENKKRPSSENINSNIASMGKWILNQLSNYKNNIYSMKNKEVKNLWEMFVDEYDEYFPDDTEIWKQKLETAQKYIDKNNKKPSDSDTNGQIQKLGQWVHRQMRNYRLNQRIMENSEIKQLWNQFLSNNSKYFLSDNDEWDNKLSDIMLYISKNEKTPSDKNPDKKIRSFGKWMIHQFENYRQNKGLMKNDIILKKWNKFTKDYRKFLSDRYFMSNEEIWKNNLKEVKEYIDDNKKRPTSGDKDENIIYLAGWISKQLKNYKNNKQIMKEPHLRKLWEEFIKDFNSYYLSNDEIWINTLEEMKIYIDNHKFKPVYDVKSDDKQKNHLGIWLKNQYTNYNLKNQIMKDDKIRKLWENFISKYDKYLN